MPHVRHRVVEHTYVVEGSGAFSFDMLRRERSWPSQTEAALKLRWGEQRQITLIARRVSDVAVERWDSFGWRIVAGFAGDIPILPENGLPYQLIEPIAA